MILGGNCYSLIDSINMSDLPHTLDSESIFLKLINKNILTYNSSLIHAKYHCKNDSKFKYNLQNKQKNTFTISHYL